MLPSEYNEYECPECSEWVRVGLPMAKYVDCPGCKSKLEIHPECEIEDGIWHDRSTLSVVEIRPSVSSDDLYREHMKRMLAKGLEWINENTGGPK